MICERIFPCQHSLRPMHNILQKNFIQRYGTINVFGTDTHCPCTTQIIYLCLSTYDAICQICFGTKHTYGRNFYTNVFYLQFFGTNARCQHSAQIIYWNRRELKFSHTSIIGGQLSFDILFPMQPQTIVSINA